MAIGTLRAALLLDRKISEGDIKAAAQSLSAAIGVTSSSVAQSLAQAAAALEETRVHNDATIAEALDGVIDISKAGANAPSCRHSWMKLNAQGRKVYGSDAIRCCTECFAILRARSGITSFGGNAIPRRDVAGVESPDQLSEGRVVFYKDGFQPIQREDVQDCPKIDLNQLRNPRIVAETPIRQEAASTRPVRGVDFDL